MSTVNLEKGSNYHIFKNGDIYSVEYHKDGKIYKKDVLLNVVTKPKVIDYCDERVRVLNDFILRRTQESIVISKE